MSKNVFSEDAIQSPFTSGFILEDPILKYLRGNLSFSVQTALIFKGGIRLIEETRPKLIN